MPNLASVLKDEIRRLARKEAKIQVASLRSASAQYRRDIASLKRENGELVKKIARLERLTKRSAPAENSSGARFSPSWVAKHRKKLGFSAADYAALVGVSPLTIYNWEKGKSRPRQEQIDAWALIRKLGKKEAWSRFEEMEA